MCLVDVDLPVVDQVDARPELDRGATLVVAHNLLRAGHALFQIVGQAQDRVLVLGKARGEVSRERGVQRMRGAPEELVARVEAVGVVERLEIGQVEVDVGKPPLARLGVHEDLRGAVPEARHVDQAGKRVEVACAVRVHAARAEPDLEQALVIRDMLDAVLPRALRHVELAVGDLDHVAQLLVVARRARAVAAAHGEGPLELRNVDRARLLAQAGELFLEDVERL